MISFALIWMNKLEDILEEAESDVANLTLRKDGIITFVPKKGMTEHNVDAMKLEFEIFINWAKDGKKRFLTDNRQLKKFESDVKVYAKQNLPLFCDKMAFVVNSGVSSFLTNFFIYLHKPEVPIKTFTTPEDALTWLREK